MDSMRVSLSISSLTCGNINFLSTVDKAKNKLTFACIAKNNSHICEQISASNVIMMKIEFRDTQLLDLYEGKPTTDKQFKSNPALVKQYVKTVNKLRAVDRIEDLFRLNSLNYKKTVGDRKGQSSVDINDQYRLHFEEIADPDSNQVVLLAIEELSNHYA